LWRKPPAFLGVSDVYEGNDARAEKKLFRIRIFGAETASRRAAAAQRKKKQPMAPFGSHRLSEINQE
jgi:hypothetical protein